MKTFFKTGFLGLSMVLSSFLSAQSTQIGHRDEHKRPMLDISPNVLLAKIESEMAIRGFTNVQIASLDISDDVGNPDYFMSMGIKVRYDDGVQTNLSISLLVPLSYNAVTNVYTVFDYRLLPVQDGGRPDKNFCVAVNCVGCESLRNEKGKLLGCSPCIPGSPNISSSCGPENTAGTGAKRILDGLGGILSGILNFL